ncbi:MAG: type IV secretory system conjugative DNA transfer family protein [Firmicutes bacterium]|nr:type IV secretory system conjugative DNA transfer family protein [Bacillota bacterium]
MDNIKFDAMSPSMTLLLFLIIGLILFILIIEPKLSRRKLKNNNEHGSSKFADIKEIKENFDKEELNNINMSGFPVWYEKEKGKFKNVYYDNKSPHYVLIGSTGSGKSITVSIPICIQFATAKEKHSVVLTDPKAELFKTTGKIFEENGYDVVTIDFRNPTKSSKINIMQPIIDEWKEHCIYDKNMMFFLSYFIKSNKILIGKMFSNKKYQEQIIDKYKLVDYIIEVIKNNQEELEKNIKNKKYFDNYSYMEYTNEELKGYLSNLSNLEILDKIKEMQNNSSNHQAEANHLVISLANLIFTEKESKDPFWINSSKQLFIGLAGIFLEDYKKGLIDENKINIASIKKFQNSSLIKENQMYLQRNLNTRSYGNLSKDYLTSILSSAENTYKSVTAVFGEKMSIFDDLNVENVTSISEFNFTDVGRKPTALYIIVPDEDKSYYQLVTIILGMLIKDLSKFANMPENNGMLPVKVEWILEEFANMPPINDIHVSVSVARSRGMRYIFFIQSFAQLDQIYGKEIASIIIDNSALCYLKTNSVECAQIIEKKLGRATITTNSLSTSTDPFKIGGNQTTSLLGRELLTANEIISLKYKTIIFPVFGNPIFRDTYMYSDLYPKYKKVAICEREIKVLKRLTDNYYTVEKLREYYDKESNNKEKVITRKIITSSQRQTKNKMRRIIKNVNGENNVISLLNNLKDWFTNRIINEIKDDDVYTLEIATLLNKMDLIRLKKLFTNDITVEIASNKKIRKTIISFWNNLEGEKYL